MTATNTQLATLNDLMVDYDGCVEAFKQADRITGQSFVVLLNALTSARDLYTETNGKTRGFIKQFEADTGRSNSYLRQLNRISKLELGTGPVSNLGFDRCVALLTAPDDIKEEIVIKVEDGETVTVSDIKQQVASAKAALSPEAFEELKEETRKEDRRIAEQKKREREEAVREKAEEYSLDADYEEMLARNGTNDDDDEPDLLITDAEYEEVPNPKERSENEQDTYDQITSMFQHCMPWAPSKELAVDIVSYIVDQYSLNLSDIIQK